MSITKTDKNGNNLYFDMLAKAADRENPDLECKKQCAIALQSFMNEPHKIKAKVQALTEKVKVQGMTVSTDLPFLTGESFNLVTASRNFDLGYEQAFQNIPRIQGKRFWSAIGVQNSLTFVKVPEGGKVVVAGITGDKVFFTCDKYGGAIGWTYEAIEGREIMQLVNLADIFRNKYFELKANIHYALLQTAAITNPVTPYDAGADGQLRRDIRTINQAILDLTTRLLNKGYGDMANAGVIIYANRSLEGRINAAMRASTDTMSNVLGGAQAVTTRPIQIIYTYNTAITAGRPIVLLPGWGLQRMDYMLPTTFTDKQDILSLNIAQAVWGDYGAGVADSEQCQNFLLS
jgi:hypothetical protein